MRNSSVAGLALGTLLLVSAAVHAEDSGDVKAIVNKAFQAAGGTTK